MQLNLIHDRVIAHRGASAYAPENTMAAFKKAFDLGSKFIEFDVMLSADNKPFVFHDNKLKRTTNGKGDFGLQSAQYIEELDAGSWFNASFANEKIPSFESLVKWITESEIFANIELKPYPNTTQQTVIEALSIINKFWPNEKKLPLISSFDYQALELTRELVPEMPLGLLLHKWDNDWLSKAQALSCVSIHINKSQINKSRIALIKNAGFSLFVYTVNNQKQALKMLNWGVDAVFSDYPDLLS